MTLGIVEDTMGCVEKWVYMKIPQSLSWIYIFLFLSIPIYGLGASEDSKYDGPPFVVRTKNNLLTVKLRDIPMEKVLAEIANQTGIQIIFYGPMEGFLSADFSDLPLHKGLRQLTRGFNHIFIYRRGKARGSASEIKEAIIFSKTDKKPNKKVEPRVIEPKKWPPQELKKATLESLVKALEDEDPEVREDAVDLLAELKDERAIVHLTEVLLNDKEEDVRESAAEAMGELGDERAIDPLIQALGDKDAGVRESAVDALAEVGGKKVISPLMGALSDEDEDVREAAADALKEITGKDFSR